VASKVRARNAIPLFRCCGLNSVAVLKFCDVNTVNYSNPHWPCKTAATSLTFKMYTHSKSSYGSYTKVLCYFEGSVCQGPLGKFCEDV